MNPNKPEPGQHGAGDTRAAASGVSGRPAGTTQGNAPRETRPLPRQDNSVQQELQQQRGYAVPESPINSVTSHALSTHDVSSMYTSARSGASHTLPPRASQAQTALPFAHMPRTSGGLYTTVPIQPAKAALPFSNITVIKQSLYGIGVHDGDMKISIEFLLKSLSFSRR